MANLREYKRKKKYSVEEEQDMDYFENKIKAHKRRIFILVMVAIIVLLIGAVATKIYIDNRVFEEYSVKNSVELGDTYGCKFYGFGDFVLRYSNDGITYINGKDTVWNQPFEMKDPLIDVCDGTVAIAETGGTTIYIYNMSGALGQVESEYPIENLAVAKQGIVSVVTSDGESGYIEVYDKKGNKLVSGRAVLSGETGYPLDLSISDDGTKMIVSFLNVTNLEINTKVVFYNFSEVGKSEVDRIVGMYGHYGDTLIPKVEFLSNNCAVAFGDKIYTIYSMKQKPEKIYEEEVDDRIKSVFYSDKYIGIVTENEDVLNPYKVKVVNTEGKTMLETDVDIDYTGIKVDKKGVILYNASEIKVIAFGGTVKYDQVFDKEIADILVTDESYTYLVVTSSGVEKIKLK
ncbi:MAG: hypothetical protein E7266_08335 [Lachnospiraceae bacterium]|nr:hypothetical protein [Lachnospiraceae bacterium]